MGSRAIGGAMKKPSIVQGLRIYRNAYLKACAACFNGGYPFCIGILL
jgi:hypothetical protein